MPRTRYAWSISGARYRKSGGRSIVRGWCGLRRWYCTRPGCKTDQGHRAGRPIDVDQYRGTALLASSGTPKCFACRLENCTGRPGRTLDNAGRRLSADLPTDGQTNVRRNLLVAVACSARKTTISCRSHRAPCSVILRRLPKISLAAPQHSCND